MQISFGNVLLAGGSRASSSGPLRISTQGMVQVSPFVRSNNASAYNRKNYRTEVSFGVDRLFTTLQAAEDTVETHAEVIKGLGMQDLTMINSGSTAYRKLKKAHCTSCSCSYRGVTVHIDYTFSGEYIE